MTDPTQRRVVCPQCGWIGRRRGKVAGDCPRCPRGTQVAWSERGVGRPTDVVGIPRSLARKLAIVLKIALEDDPEVG